MSTRPPYQHEALSEEERDFARVVRALPGGEPPTALDALILKAATDAVASHSSHKSRWTKSLFGTSALWLGTAAASILTLGIGWQVFQSMQAPIYELPPEENISSRQEVDSSHKSESISVEMMPARAPLPTSPPPITDDASAVAAKIIAAEKPATGVPMRAELEQRERKALAKQVMADNAQAKTKEESISRNQAAEADWVAPAAAGAIAASPAPPPPMPVVVAAPAAVASVNADKANDNLTEMDAVAVTGSRMSRADAPISQAAKTSGRDERASTAQKRIADDAKLPPVEWLELIRARVKLNDIEGAKASLKLFKKTHRRLQIPDDLKPLLQ